MNSGNRYVIPEFPQGAKSYRKYLESVGAQGPEEENLNGLSAEEHDLLSSFQVNRTPEFWGQTPSIANTIAATTTTTNTTGGVNQQAIFFPPPSSLPSLSSSSTTTYLLDDYFSNEQLLNSNSMYYHGHNHHNHNNDEVDDSDNSNNYHSRPLGMHHSVHMNSLYDMTHPIEMPSLLFGDNLNDNALDDQDPLARLSLLSSDLPPLPPLLIRPQPPMSPEHSDIPPQSPLSMQKRMQGISRCSAGKSVQLTASQFNELFSGDRVKGKLYSPIRSKRVNGSVTRSSTQKHGDSKNMRMKDVMMRYTSLGKIDECESFSFAMSMPNTPLRPTQQINTVLGTPCSARSNGGRYQHNNSNCSSNNSSKRKKVTSGLCYSLSSPSNKRQCYSLTNTPNRLYRNSNVNNGVSNRILQNTLQSPNTMNMMNSHSSHTMHDMNDMSGVMKNPRLLFNDVMTMMNPDHPVLTFTSLKQFGNTKLLTPLRVSSASTEKPKRQTEMNSSSEKMSNNENVNTSFMETISCPTIPVFDELSQVEQASYMEHESTDDHHETCSNESKAMSSNENKQPNDEVIESSNSMSSVLQVNESTHSGVNSGKMVMVMAEDEMSDHRKEMQSSHVLQTQEVLNQYHMEYVELIENGIHIKHVTPQRLQQVRSNMMQDRMRSPFTHAHFVLE